MKYILTAFFLFFTIALSAQFRMVGTGSWTVVDDSTYTATVTFGSDLTGNSFLPTNITDTMRVFTGTQQLYRISNVTGATFSSADLTIVEIAPTNGAPTGQVMVFEQMGKNTIPQVPFGSTGATAQLQAAVVTWNANNSGGSSSTEVNGIYSSSNNNTLMGVDTIRYDSILRITPNAAGMKGVAFGDLSNDPSGELSFIGGGESNTASGISSTVGGGENNTASERSSTIGGGEDNIASREWSTVGGGENNAADGDYSFVGGGGANTASGDISFVGGGQNNNADGDYSTVAGGTVNDASGIYSFVGGGQNNTASGANSTVSGGTYNTASGEWSTVGGGGNNNADGYASAVIGGRYNDARGAYSTIGGGISNVTDEDGSTISGGSGNTADTSYAVVAGGLDNTASGYASNVGGGDSNAATSLGSTVAGGKDNTASAYVSTVGGGTFNTADGYASAVIGGQYNTAHSLSEAVIGQYATNYTAQSATAFDTLDRIFTVGIGTTDIDRADAFRLWKSGQADLPSYGAGTFVEDTAAVDYLLAIDTNGVVREVDIDSIGGGGGGNGIYSSNDTIKEYRIVNLTESGVLNFHNEFQDFGGNEAGNLRLIFNQTQYGGPFIQGKQFSVRTTDGYGMLTVSGVDGNEDYTYIGKFQYPFKALMFNTGINGILVDDSDDGTGLHYNSDYSGNFSARSLPDVAWVENYIDTADIVLKHDTITINFQATYGAVSSGTQNGFWVVPDWLDGAELISIQYAVLTAPTGGDLSLELQFNGGSVVGGPTDAVIASGTNIGEVDLNLNLDADDIISVVDQPASTYTGGTENLIVNLKIIKP